MKNRKQVKFLLICILLISITVGYAFLNTTLSIKGTFFDGTDKVEYVQLTYIKNWDGYVAETNGKLFADLQSALSYSSSGSKVKLLKDTNEFVTNNAENVTLDLNGNKLNGKIINK